MNRECTIRGDDQPRIIGDDRQAVVISMSAGDEVRAEAGAMTYTLGDLIGGDS